MHPDSRLATGLDYLVPLAGEIPIVPLKPVREIEVLDPACGTMHFGLVAFDLLAEMYREEMGESRAAPAMPEKPCFLHLLPGTSPPESQRPPDRNASSRRQGPMLRSRDGLEWNGRNFPGQGHKIIKLHR